MFSSAAILAVLAAAGLALSGVSCAPRSPAEAGTEDRALTNDGGKNFAPHYSPDGQWIAYSAQLALDKGQMGVFLIRPDGSGLTRLQPDTLAMSAIAWAEDGRSLFVNAVKENRVLQIGLDGTILDSIDRPGLSHFCDYSPTRREFLYVQFTGDNRDLGIVKRDDPKPQLLAGTPSWEEDGCFGPGPDKITGVSRPSFQAPSSRISIWTQGSTEVTQIPLPAALNRHPAWSPDGRYMAYSTDRNGPADIWLFDSVTARSFQVTSGPEESVNAAWSPDGAWIAYNRTKRSSHVFLGDPITHEKHQVTFGDDRDVSPTVSPDGKKLVFIRVEANTPEKVSRPALYVQSTGGTGDDARPLDLAGLVVSGQEFGLLQWSPDSREIAFSADDGTGSVNVYRLAVDGGAPVQVTAGSGGKIGPSWSPDGRYIGYTMTAGGETQVYAIPADGGLAKKISHSGTVNEILAWAPNSDDVAYLSVLSNEVYEVRRTTLSHPETSSLVARSTSLIYPVGWTKDGASLLMGHDRDGLFCFTATGVKDGREVELGCELRDENGKSLFIDLNEEGKKHVTCIYPANIAAFADGEEVSEIHVKRVAELIEMNLVAERGR